MPDSLFIQNLRKSISFPNGASKLLIDIESLKISLPQHGSISTFLAPAGSGKTYFTRVLSKVENPDAGKIQYELNDSEVKNFIPLITEKPFTLPWLTVSEQLKYVLKANKISMPENEILKYLDLVGLSGYEKFIPQNINSGFKFRISLAVSLVLKKGFIIIDDCFKDYESETKNELFNILFEILKKEKVNLIFITSDILEALYLADTIVLMTGSPLKVRSVFENIPSYEILLQVLDSKEFKSLKQAITASDTESGIGFNNYSF